MKTKNILFIAIIVLILATLGIAIAFFSGIKYFYFQKNTGSAQEENNFPQKQGITVKEKSIITAEKPFNISITYPYVEGLEDFNKKSEELVNNELFEFKKISLENDQAVKELSPETYEDFPREYFLNILYQEEIKSQEIISIVFEISNYTGGAHGATYYKALNYNIKDKREIKLSELFLNQPDYLQKISQYSVNDLKRQIQENFGGDEGSWIEDGAGPKEENFSAFLIKENSIVFYFAPYQVASYAAGPFTVEMPQ